MEMNTNNHNNKGGIAVLCPFGCGIIVKWEIDSSGGKDYYSDMRTGEKHHCHHESHHIAVVLSPQSTLEGRTEKANRAITRIELVNILQSILDFNNDHHI